jgi:CubicO group peptidase (beta-lactamase class C family)
MQAERVRHVGQVAQSWIDNGTHSALVLLAARRGVVVLHQAFGNITPEPDALPLTTDALFYIASMSKTITATCIMSLVEEGRVGLNRPVMEYVPEFTGEGKESVLIHHLLTHTSGLDDDAVGTYLRTRIAEGSVPPLDAWEQNWPPDPFLQALRFSAALEAPLCRAPGELMSYCSFGYNILGEVAVRASKMSLAELSRERVFVPLGMHDTFREMSDDACWARVVRRGPGAPGYPWLDSRERLPAHNPSGNIWSTAMDQAILGQTFLNGGAYGEARILSPASAAAMTRDQIPGVAAVFGPERFQSAGWGLGWGVQLDKKAVNWPSLTSAEAFCTGGAGGVLMWIDPAYDLLAVYFSVVNRGVQRELREWNIDKFVNMLVGAITD